MTKRGPRLEDSRPSHRTSHTEHRSQKRNTPAQIYDDLLDEALQQSSPDLGRPLKRRKSQRGADEVITIDSGDSGVDESKGTSERDVVVIDSSSNDGENSDDDEMEWDNVDLTTFPTSDDIPDTQESPSIREVTLTTTPQKSTFALSFNGTKNLGRNEWLEHLEMRLYDKFVWRDTKCIYCAYLPPFVISILSSHLLHSSKSCAPWSHQQPSMLSPVDRK